MAEEYHLTENRVRQCISRALGDLNGNRRMFAYITNGYCANVEILPISWLKKKQFIDREEGFAAVSIFFIRIFMNCHFQREYIVH